MKTKILLTLFLMFFLSNYVFASDGLRSQFLNNKTVICAINIRNFNSDDKNGDGFIEKDEIRGNFINAIDRLDEIKSLGINTLHVLPVTPTGKLKALGTAGSLYAISDFRNINEQLRDENSKLTALEQAALFVEECHKRGIWVIFDLPSCGSYDFFLKHPELFVKDEKRLSVVPADWTDVRLFKSGNNDKLNQDLIEEHKKYIDMVQSIGVDGIRADVATIKPYKFWEEIIKYARGKNPEFLFLAEASDSWREPPSRYAEFTPYDQLLKSGFDGYYGSFFNLKDWKQGVDLIEHIKFNKKLLSSYKDKKSLILSFTTHDEVSPILLHGKNFSIMISWLEGTLPFNPYIIDGFTTGDDYLYKLANTKSRCSDTDDDTYFVHRGKLDIFNFSAKPKGQYPDIEEEFRKAASFRNSNTDLISEGKFIPLKTDTASVFAFARSYNNQTVIVIGNLDFKNNVNKAVVTVPGLRKNNKIEYIKTDNCNIKFKRGKMAVNLPSGGIIVLLLNNFGL